MKEFSLVLHILLQPDQESLSLSKTVAGQSSDLLTFMTKLYLTKTVHMKIL